MRLSPGPRVVDTLTTSDQCELLTRRLCSWAVPADGGVSLTAMGGAYRTCLINTRLAE